MSQSRPRIASLGLAWVLMASSSALGGAAKPKPEDLAGWPIEVKGHASPRPGEHPRLLFRKSDLPALRERAKTPEGQALLRRLRVQLNGGDGGGLAIDFSRASGADGMIIQAGPAAGKGTALQAGGQTFSFLFLTTGKAPEPRVEGDKIIVGEQTVSWDGKRIVLGR